MDVFARLKELGFARVEVVDGPSCGVEEPSLLIALMPYEMEEEPARHGAWVHPYYRTSHRAYMAVRAIVAEAEAEGIPLRLRDEIRMKPIFARMPGFSQGRNTLSYVEGLGSRFYVKMFSLDMPVEPTLCLEDEHGLHCGACRRCMESCPTGAITENGFRVERCLRWWMLNGRVAPEDVRVAMGNGLVGCDVCQRCCPHNPAPTAPGAEPMDVARMLREPKAVAEELKGVIGANLAISNRLLAQACLIAGNSGEEALVPLLHGLRAHPSETVRVHAAWAEENIERQGR